MAFVWYELMTSDPAAAAGFYGAVTGWSFKSGDGPHGYTEIVAPGGAHIGGILQTPTEAAAMPPAWLGYVGVDDLDAASAKLQAAGGGIHKGPVDMPGVGRWSVASDPQGGVFYLFQPTGPMGEGGGAAEAVGWHELYTTDLDAALSFYGDQFGWVPSESLDMGPAGRYQMFNEGGRMIGGMMRRPAEQIPVGWMFYFLVDSAAAAAERITTAGGAVRMGPMEVPGGSWVLQGTDAQGAAFALTSPNP